MKNFGYLLVLFGVLEVTLSLGCENLTILSGDDYPNDGFIWAKGIYNLTFSTTISCNCTTCGGTCVIDWKYTFQNSTSATFETNYVSSFSARVEDRTQGKYLLNCSRSGGRVTFSVKMLFHLETNFNITAVKRGTDCSTQQDVVIKSCESKKKSFVKMSSSSPSKFMESTTYSCCDFDETALIIDQNTTNLVPNYSRTCQFNGNWNGTGDIQCYFPPSVELLINSRGVTPYKVEETLELICNATKEGNPSNSTSTFFLDFISPDGTPQHASEIPSVLVTNYTMHNAKVYCQMVNAYVSLINKSSGFSKHKVLSISFGPVALDADEKEIEETIGKKVSLEYKFAANPPVLYAGLQLKFKKESSEAPEKLNISNQSLSPRVQYQNYTHTIESVNITDYGTYTLIITSSDPRFSDPLEMAIALKRPSSPTKHVSIGTTNVFDYSTISVSTTYVTSQPIGLLVGSIIGGVVLVVIVVLVILVIKRRTASKSDGSLKEEKNNPIYGSSAGPAIEAAKEKDNPIYKSSDDTGAGIEEAYAEVKKEKKDGTQNVAYRTDAAEVTYAAVNKPKKTAAGLHSGTPNVAYRTDVAEVTYAAVNKPKKQAHVTKEQQVEAVYSAVDKKKKGKVKMNDPELHGSHDASQ